MHRWRYPSLKQNQKLHPDSWNVSASSGHPCEVCWSTIAGTGVDGGWNSDRWMEALRSDVSSGVFTVGGREAENGHLCQT